MARDPWTDPDPQPGDFDAELLALDPRYVELHRGNPSVKVTIVREEDVDPVVRERPDRPDSPSLR